ncbi:MAG: SIMPL domain-containing protein [Phycisphaerales bacterium]
MNDAMTSAARVVRRFGPTAAVLAACGVMRVSWPAVTGAMAQQTASGREAAQAGKLPPGAEDVQGKITSTGLARVQRTPDHLDVVLGVEVLGATAGQTQNEATERMDAVVRALRMMGLEGAKFQTGSADLSPRYEQRNSGDEAAKIVGYRSAITLSVRTTDLKAAARIIDTGLKAGANRVDRVAFGIREAIGAREEAIKMAAGAAKRKASVMAEALGLQIVGVEVANTDVAEFGGWGNRMSQVANESQDGPGQGDDAYVPGTVEVSSTVSVTFITRPAATKR